MQLHGWRTLMPVLVEKNSVIVRRDAIDARMQGGWEEFQRLAPAETLCADEDIVRVGFDEIEAAAEFIGLLLARGLRYGAGSNEDDIATFSVESSSAEPKTKRSPGDWIVYSYLVSTGTGWRVLCGRLKDGQAPRDEIAVPVGWDYETSASRALRVS